MCLSEVYTDEDMNRIVEELPEVAPGVVEVLCLAIDDNNCFESLNRHKKYAAGINHATKVHIEKNQIRYWSGYHSFTDLSLRSCISNCLKTFPHQFSGRGRYIRLLTCLVRKNNITAAGIDELRIPTDKHRLCPVIVAEEAFFPTYPETEAKLEDFLKWLKENDKEYSEALTMVLNKIKAAIAAAKE